MSITSFYFLCFLLIVLVFYYVIPKKLQWLVILAASVVYYLSWDVPVLILYPLGTAAVCYAGGRIIASAGTRAGKRGGLIFSLGGTVGILFVLRYINFGIYSYNGIASFTGWKEAAPIQFLVPLGLSFYTFNLLGYVIDVYFGLDTAEKNPFKLGTYGMYFPIIISGPILRYREMKEELFTPHDFQYGEVTFGIQRMLWGFFKKLVISERLAIVVNTVYAGYEQYPGFYIWIASFCFLFQLYTDFSGCMDIVIGLSQVLGIHLPENFKTPFFSVSISEYWRRWHITLGNWMKDYVFYPLLRSGFMQKTGKRNRKWFGKKRGKQITTYLGMFILWFSVGIWHGGEWTYVIGSGLLHWSYIVLGDIFEPVFKKVKAKLSIPPKGTFMRVLGIIRTFLLVNFGLIFFRADSVSAAWKMIISMFHMGNGKILFDGSLFQLGLDGIEFTIAAVSLLLLFFVSCLQEKGVRIREGIAAKSLPVRWLIWYFLLFYVILLGYYGPEYSAQEFIYQGF